MFEPRIQTQLSFGYTRIGWLVRTAPVLHTPTVPLTGLPEEVNVHLNPVEGFVFL